MMYSSSTTRTHAVATTACMDIRGSSGVSPEQIKKPQYTIDKQGIVSEPHQFVSACWCSAGSETQCWLTAAVHHDNSKQDNVTSGKSASSVFVSEVATQQPAGCLCGWQCCCSGDSAGCCWCCCCWYCVFASLQTRSPSSRRSRNSQQDLHYSNS